MEANIALRPLFDDFARDPAILKSILENVGDALFLCDIDGVLVHLNGLAARLLADCAHVRTEPRPGIPLSAILNDRDGVIAKLLQNCFTGNGPVSCPYTLPETEDGKGGQRLLLVASAVRSGGSDVSALAMIRVRDDPNARDRVERLNDRLERTYRALELERRLSRRDTLTGLLNRREFFNALKSEMDYADRYDQPLCLVCIDIDHFKSVNDRYGHPAGDEVLKQLGALVAKTMRRLDKPGRVGGEEFAIVLPGVVCDGAAKAAERLRAAIEASPVVFQGARINVTASFGVVEYERTGEKNLSNRQRRDESRKGHRSESADWSSLYERGDAALYRAKKNGRNQVVVA